MVEAIAAYRRMVLRSMPVARATSLWLLPSASSVWMVVCLFVWLQDVQLLVLRVIEGQFTSCPKAAGGAGATTLSRSVQVEEFEVAMGGGIWVAVRENWGRKGVRDVLT